MFLFVKCIFTPFTHFVLINTYFVNFFCLVCSLPNKSANSVSLVPYLHISKISTTGLLPAYFSKFLKIFFFIFFQDLSNSFKINAQGMRELCLKFDRDICVRWPWDLLENCWRYILEIFLRWVINKGMYFHFDLFEWNLAFSDANMIFQTPQTWTFCPISTDPPPPSLQN